MSLVVRHSVIRNEAGKNNCFKVPTVMPYFPSEHTTENIYTCFTTFKGYILSLHQQCNDDTLQCYKSEADMVVI